MSPDRIALYYAHLPDRLQAPARMIITPDLPSDSLTKVEIMLKRDPPSLPRMAHRYIGMDLRERKGDLSPLQKERHAAA